MIAVWAFVTAAAITVALMTAAAPRPWRVLLFVPIWLGVLASFESSSRTCVMLAARGLRNMDDGDERVEDPGELRQLTRQSRQVHVRALVLSAALTGALYVL